jgi:SnoaL-like domain
MLPQALQSLRDAINSHVPQRIADCFTEDYVAERPLRPAEGFIGSGEVAANWTKILAGLPDLHVEILRHAQNGDELWSEWEYRGTAPTGTTVVLRGPVILPQPAGLTDSRSAAPRGGVGQRTGHAQQGEPAADPDQEGTGHRPLACLPGNRTPPQQRRTGRRTGTAGPHSRPPRTPPSAAHPRRPTRDRYG